MYSLDQPETFEKKHVTAETVYDVAVVARTGDGPTGMSAARKKELIVKAMERKQRRINMTCLVLGMFGLIASVGESELLFDNEDEPNSLINLIKGAVSVSTLALLIMVVVKTVSMLKLSKKRGALDADESLSTSGYLGPMLFELIVCLVHSPPGVHFMIALPGIADNGDIEYSFDALCSLWQLMRLYLCVAVMNDMVGFRTAQARVIAKWNNVAFNAAFTFKALMERAPLRLLGVVMLSLVLILGYCVRVFERPLCVPWKDAPPICVANLPRNDPNSLGNLFWFVVITMTTVGYGDMFPLTHGGRLVALVTCLVGFAVIALLVTVITTMSTFAPDEMRAFNALYRNTGRKTFQHGAARMVQGCWVYYIGVKYKARLKAGDTPAQAAKNLQNFKPTARRRSSVLQTLRRLSNTGTGASAKYSLGNGNLHMRHKSKFGKSRLLKELRRWKACKAEFLALTKEKSEVAMVVKEILDVRGRLNEMNEQQEMHSELMATTNQRIARVERMLEQVCMAMNVNVPKAKSLEPLQRSQSPPKSGTITNTSSPARDMTGPGSSFRKPPLGHAGSQRGGIQWQWSGSGAGEETKADPQPDAVEELISTSLPGGMNGSVVIPRNALSRPNSMGSI